VNFKPKSLVKTLPWSSHFNSGPDENNLACRCLVEKSVSLTAVSIYHNKAAFTIEVAVFDEMINISCIFT